MPDVAPAPRDDLGKKIVKGLSEEGTHTDSPVSADTEEARAPVSPSLDDRCDGSSARASPVGLLHHSLGWRMAPGESKTVINLKTKGMVQKDNH